MIREKIIMAKITVSKPRASGDDPESRAAFKLLDG